ncbi:MAG: hypothetical protein ACRCRZ_01930 [Metamycoplasmataceae bacterium]
MNVNNNFPVFYGTPNNQQQSNSYQIVSQSQPGFQPTYFVPQSQVSTYQPNYGNIPSQNYIYNQFQTNGGSIVSGTIKPPKPMPTPPPMPQFIPPQMSKKNKEEKASINFIPEIKELIEIIKEQGTIIKKMNEKNQKMIPLNNSLK